MACCNLLYGVQIEKGVKQPLAAGPLVITGVDHAEGPAVLLRVRSCASPITLEPLNMVDVCQRKSL